MSAEESAPAGGSVQPETKWMLRLYVAGQSPNSMAALANLNGICKEHLEGRYQLEVVDLLARGAAASGDEIVALPTLVRLFPAPMKKIVGDLADTEWVVTGLEIRPRR